VAVCYCVVEGAKSRPQKRGPCLAAQKDLKNVQSGFCDVDPKRQRCQGPLVFIGVPGNSPRATVMGDPALPVSNSIPSTRGLTPHSIKEASETRRTPAYARYEIPQYVLWFSTTFRCKPFKLDKHGVLLSIRIV
jgi:hypothetical protein